MLIENLCKRFSFVQKRQLWLVNCSPDSNLQCVWFINQHIITPLHVCVPACRFGNKDVTPETSAANLGTASRPHADLLDHQSRAQEGKKQTSLCWKVDHVTEQLPTDLDFHIEKKMTEWCWVETITWGIWSIWFCLIISLSSYDSCFSGTFITDARCC